MNRELRKISDELQTAADGIADPKGEFAGPILSRLQNHQPDKLLFKEKGDSKLKEASLAVLTVTDHEDQVIVAPHLRAQVAQHLPEVRRVARDARGKVYFAVEALP